MAGPTYDTGLARAQRTLLRAALATQLAPLLFSNGGYVRGPIRHLPRPLKNNSPDEIGWLGNVTQGQAPSIAIALGRSELEHTGVDIRPVDVRAKVDVAIYVASNSLRNYIEGRMDVDVSSAADPTKDPGIETMLEHVEQYLLGQSFDLSTGLIDGGQAAAAAAPRHVTSELRIEHEDELDTLGDVTIWELRGHIYLQREINPDRAITQAVTEIQGLHSLEPTSDPENPLVETRTELS